VPVGGVSMYEHLSCWLNRSVTADLGGSSGYRGISGANSSGVDDRGHRASSKHLSPGSWARPTNRLRQAGKSSVTAPAESQQQMRRRLSG
jgi:hypothetical protein